MFVIYICLTSPARLLTTRCISQIETDRLSRPNNSVFVDVSYWWGNSDIQHHLWRLTLDGSLCVAPISPNVSSALDLGTGTGIWAIEVCYLVHYVQAQAYPYIVKPLVCRRAPICLHSWCRSVIHPTYGGTRQLLFSNWRPRKWLGTKSQVRIHPQQDSKFWYPKLGHDLSTVLFAPWTRWLGRIPRVLNGAAMRRWHEEYKCNRNDGKLRVYNFLV